MDGQPITTDRPLAQPGRAPALQAGWHWFKPSRADHNLAGAITIRGPCHSALDVVDPCKNKHMDKSTVLLEAFTQLCREGKMWVADEQYNDVTDDFIRSAGYLSLKIGMGTATEQDWEQLHQYIFVNQGVSASDVMAEREQMGTC